MCDTFVAVPEFTGGSTILAKNSDREPNEAQALERIVAKAHTERQVQTTFIAIPQVKETYEVILSRPFHMWGAEMGGNEHGLAIGNEAVFTRLAIAKKNTGLTGMDVIRLALERTRTASEALDLMTRLIEEYGQDACGGYKDKSFFYHNSFIIADSREAWILETADRHWAALRVQTFRSISNGLSIESDFDRISKGAEDFARSRGWVSQGRDFSFREAFSDKFFTHFSMCRARREVSARLGQAYARHHYTAPIAMSILRTHTEAIPEGRFDPSRCDMSSLCMHATGLLTPSQTTGSMVAELRHGRPSTFWFTGSAAPCVSLFKPFFAGGKTLLADSFPVPGATPDGSLWWKHEKIHRGILKNYAAFAPDLQRAIAELERAFQADEARLIERGAASGELDALSAKAIQQNLDLIKGWEARNDRGYGFARPLALLYRFYRWKQNRAVGL